MRGPVLVHSSEALVSRQAVEALSRYSQDCLIEFLKSLQLASLQAISLSVNENGQPKLGLHGPNRFLVLARARH